MYNVLLWGNNALVDLVHTYISVGRHYYRSVGMPPGIRCCSSFPFLKTFMAYVYMYCLYICIVCMHASTLLHTHTYVYIVTSFLTFPSLGNTPLHLAVTMGHQGELGHAE